MFMCENEGISQTNDKRASITTILVFIDGKYIKKKKKNHAFIH